MSTCAEAAGRDAESIAKRSMPAPATCCSPSAAAASAAPMRRSTALAQRGEVIAHGIALQPGRTTAVGRIGKIAGHCAVGRAGSGARGVVDAGASGAGPAVGPAAAADRCNAAAGAQDRLRRRHRRDRAAASETHGAWMPLAVGELSLDAIARAEAWLVVPGGAEGFAAGAPVDALYAAGLIESSDMTNAQPPRSRDGVEQDQFLTILSREEALARFEAALFPRPRAERTASAGRRARLRAGARISWRRSTCRRSTVPMSTALRCAPPILPAAGEATPVRLMLNDEVIACGTAPTRPVLSGTATSIATGGPVPRGADAIVMVEHTQPAGPRAIEIRRAASPGQFVSYAGSDIARGETLLRAGTVIGSREIGMLAACGIAQVSVGAPAARCRHLHRRRTGAAGREAAARRDLRHQRRDRHRGGARERRRSGVSRRHCRRRSKTRSRDARGA